MNWMKFAAFAVFGFAAPAQAQDCVAVCSYEFWNQTPDQITAGLETADVKARDAEGKTPLHWAARSGSLMDVQTLIAAGADPNAVDSEGATPLMNSAMSNEINAIALIGAGADIAAKDAYGGTPLHIAAIFSEKLTQALLDAGADIAAKDNMGCMPIQYAAGSRQPQIIPILLRAGADVNAPCKNGNTPLFAAATAKWPDNISILVNSGRADVKAVNIRGQTALHWAAMFAGSAENIEALLLSGVDPSIKDQQGKTAYDLAKGRDDLAGTAALESLKSAQK